MFKFLTNLFLWIFRHEPAWLQPYNELIAGLLGSLTSLTPGLASLTNGHPVLISLVAFNIVSFGYEDRVDPNGFSIIDVGERFLAFVLGVVILNTLGAF